LLASVDSETARLLWDIGQTLLIGAVGLHQYLIARDRVRREQLSRLEETVDARVEEHQTRIVRVESMLQQVPKQTDCHASHQRIARLEQAREHAPNKVDLERVHARIDDVSNGLAGMRGELHSVVRLLTTIDQYLRDHPHRAS